MNCQERKENMELELKQAVLDAYETGGELVLTQEETAETIVPDYSPDMARVIAADGKVYLHSRELREGRAEVSGTVRVTVLYVPDGTEGLRTLEFAMPFTAESDSRGLPECTVLTAEAEPEFLESRMLNPRKLFTHCKLVIHVIGYQRRQTAFCTDVDADPALGVEKKREQQHAMILAQIAEKDFTFTEEMNLSPGRDGAAELLHSQVSAGVTETKIVGSKLLCKGTFSVALLYRTAEGRYCSTSGELPFSQILDVEGVGEEAQVSVRLQLTGTDFQIDGDDPEGRQIAVTLYLHATALLRESQELMLLSDLYSTAHELAYEASPMRLTSFYETLTRRQTVREVLEIGALAESILFLSAACGPVSVTREGETAQLRTTVTIRALYLDEGGVPLAAERTVDVTGPAELPGDCRITARAVCPEEVQGSLGDRGIEVRFPVEFQAEASTQVQRVCVSAARLDTESVRDLTGRPSLVLRCMNRQESAWDLAKAYNTTIPAILAANQLEAETEIPRDKLLLIPRTPRVFS